MDDGKTYDIEIMRAGIFRDMNERMIAVEADTMRELADSYDEKAGAAPLVLGHPKTNGPAVGWVKSLAVKGDKLVATVGQIPVALRDAVNAGSYRKCSASWYLPKTPNSPNPARHYLRHIGLLGAAVPAITGLADVALAASEDAEGVVSFSDAPMAQNDVVAILRGIMETLAIAMTPAQVADLIPQAVQDAIKGDGDVSPAALCDSLNAADAALKARLSSLVAVEASTVQDAVSFAESRNEDFVSDMVQQGRLLPFAREDVKRILTTLDTGDAVSFSDPNGEDEEKNPADVLREIIGGAVPAISFAELTLGNGSTAGFSYPDVSDDELIRERMAEANAAGRSLSSSQAAEELGLI